MTKRVADVLIETLQAAGVERCYGIVGDTLNQIAHAIDRSTIQWIHMGHEEAGVHQHQIEGTGSTAGLRRAGRGHANVAYSRRKPSFDRASR